MNYMIAGEYVSIAIIIKFYNYLLYMVTEVQSDIVRTIQIDDKVLQYWSTG